MTGPVFVIHGVLDDLDYAVVVVPTDEAFSVELHWDPVVGASGAWAGEPSPHTRLAGRARHGHGRSRSCRAPQLWAREGQLPGWVGLLEQLGTVYGADLRGLDSDLDKAELLSQRGEAGDAVW